MEPLSIIALAIAFIIGIVVHESSHAYAADKLGDPTARVEGRVSLNPINHIDPIGTILLPAFLILTGTGFVFGWAKPVPVNPFNFRNPSRDRLLVALAGPLSNFVIAGIFALIARFLPIGNNNLPMLLLSIITVNLSLMMFNLIPLPPLDGSAIWPVIFPNNASFLYNIERQGFVYLLGFLILDSVTNGAILGLLVRTPVEFFLRLFLG